MNEQVFPLFSKFNTLSDEARAGLRCVWITPVEVMEFSIA